MKKAFTLIELLAVIIVLGIIALIATPVVINVIKQAQDASFLDSVYGIKRAAEYNFMEGMFDDSNKTKVVYTYPGSEEALKVSGENPDYGYLVMQGNGQVALALWSDRIGKCAVKNYDEARVYYDESITLKDDCIIESERQIKETEVFDGWIKLTLYYPANSTERMWRLGSEGEVRTDDNLTWEDYTGPITIPLTQVENVWIKYKINDEYVIIPPSGRVLVDIEPEKTSGLVDQIKVKINYDQDATVKEYRIGNSDWITYSGEFIVSENVMIEARAIKDDSVYDSEGNKILTRQAVGRDYYYINNIGVEESELSAPTIERIDPVGDEVARIRITYPENAVDKIYKINYGEERNYSEELSIEKYGTYVMAYYYDATGKRSKTSGIHINEATTSSDYNQEEDVTINPPYDGSIGGTGAGSGGNNEDGSIVLPPGVPIAPKYQIKAPTIKVSPTEVTSSVNVSVEVPDNADKVYIKVGTNAYQLYTNYITLTENALVQAYYVTYDGERSNTAYKYISNIKQGNLPYITINASPYPYPNAKGASSVSVSLETSDANKVEYSLNGIEYIEYAGSFTINKNMRIYARAINSYGVKETYLDITNIGNTGNTGEKPEVKENLSVNIIVVPEPTLSSSLLSKVKVKIDYDSKATKKYYSNGLHGDLQEYTGEFEVTKNTTIYAYAISDNGSGQSYKVIDNINTGISEPKISIQPSNSTQASKDTVTITYDTNANVKRYSINGGSLRDYTGPFVVEENCTIYAYSRNALGEEASSNYQITNILAQNQFLIIDRGDYFLLYLNYPEESTGREYKFKDNGEWKSYKSDGILLVKSQYKNNVIDNDTVKIKIENDNGEMINFNGDYYILDVSITEIFENIYMRWDRTTPSKPQIIPDTIEPTKEVNISIVYDSSLIKKQYKVIDKEGNIITDWTNYTGIFKVTNKDAIIYARGQDDAEVWSYESTYKVSNIDEEAPVINLITDLENPTRQLGIRVNVTDDVAVNQVKWAKGIQGKSYFNSNGNVIENNSIVSINENDYYTFYATDYAGNDQIYTININNIDLNPPLIDITVSPSESLVTSVNISIDYGDATEKQYKIGDSQTWNTYSSTFALDSYYIINNNLENSDKTLTIYAKGKDSVGNEVIESYKVLNLDLDMPLAPVIESNAGYPILTSYGVEVNSGTTIRYDTRNDVTNYYSLDNGTTWIEYTGSFDLASGTIIAKSVKNNTGLEITSSSNVGLPIDALGINAYDGNAATYEKGSGKYIKVDSSMIGKTIYFNGTIWMVFLDENKQEISRSYLNIDVPEGTKWITFATTGTQSGNVYEITTLTEPTFNAENGYMLLTADPAKAIRSPYQMIKINYFDTSVQRLYKIGASGEWQNYQDKTVLVNQGETIYAKGIDQYGNETRITSSYTVNITDALGSLAFDGNTTTYERGNGKYIKVDSSMIGKTVYFNGMAWMIFLDGNKQEISRSYSTVIIPSGTEWMTFTTSGSQSGNIYEIQPADEPTFSAENGYMLLNADLTKSIRTPYQMITINYFAASVQKLYKIGSTGEWQEYQNKPVWVNQGEIIYAKGIDQYGNETRITSSYTVNATDALGSLAFDGNTSTYEKGTGKYIKVDGSMIGKTVYFNGSAWMVFLDGNKQEISRSYSTILIPEGTKWITFATSGTQSGNVNEISPVQ